MKFVVFVILYGSYILLLTTFMWIFRFDHIEIPNRKSQMAFQHWSFRDPNTSVFLANNGKDCDCNMVDRYPRG